MTAGEFVGDGYGRDGHYTFVWRYTCSRCGRTFKASAPELSEPVTCHGCFVGDAARQSRDRWRKRRKRQP